MFVNTFYYNKGELIHILTLWGEQIVSQNVKKRSVGEGTLVHLISAVINAPGT